jgi:cell division septation protein DedD
MESQSKMARRRHAQIAATAQPVPVWRIVRLTAGMAVLAALAACSSTQQLSSVQEASQYRAHAHGNYTPPGPASDPWGPYISEAALNYDVPEKWIREVIRQESSFQVMSTSAPGAMGLMQIMPSTYDELRARYNLGDDPYDPHDNIMAGTAYIRELYDLYGSPGFLAAYNAGPGRLDDYLTRHKPLPDETRNYVARIGPRIDGTFPTRLSPAQTYAMNQLPYNIPPGPRPSRIPVQAPVALAENRRSSMAPRRVDSTPLASPTPPNRSPQPQYLAQNTPQAAPEKTESFHLIPRAMADTLPTAGAAGPGWAVQVGAYANPALARAAAEAAHNKVQLLGSRPMVGSVKKGSNTLYRARLVGLSHDAALQACQKLGRSESCIVLSPEAQS